MFPTSNYDTIVLDISNNHSIHFKIIVRIDLND